MVADRVRAQHETSDDLLRRESLREQTEDLGSHKAPPPDEEPKGPAPTPSTGTKAASGSDEPEDVLQ